MYFFYVMRNFLLIIHYLLPVMNECNSISFKCSYLKTVCFIKVLPELKKNNYLYLNILLFTYFFYWYLNNDYAVLFVFSRGTIKELFCNILIKFTLSVYSPL